MGNERLHMLYALKLLLVILCLCGISGAARAENPLFQPITDQNLPAIEFLIRQGIDVNQPNEFGLTPLEFAIRSRSVAASQLLFRYGASFNLIDQAVINEFRIKPGIGAFVEKYSQLESPINQVPTPQTQANQRQAQQTLTIAQTPQTDRVPSNTTNIALANRSYPANLSDSLRPQNSIGIAEDKTQTQIEQPQTANTITLSPRRQLGSLSTPHVSTPQISTSQNLEQISALKQSSDLLDFDLQNTAQDLDETVQSTLTTLPTPVQEITVSPEVIPQEVSQENLQETIGQVHFDNPSQSCSVKNYNLVVTFTFDDGESTDLAVIEEVFAPRQATGTLGVVLDRINSGSGRYMDANTLKNLQNNGWEIASHTINHDDLTSLDKDALDSNLLTSHKGLGELGFDISTLVYPYGANNKLVRAHTSKYYYGAFEGGYRLNTRSSNPFKLKRFHIAEAHDFAYYKRVTDAYSNQHGWLVWAVHTNMNFHQEQVDDMHKLLDYMCDQGIRVVNAREGLDHLNLVDYE